MRETNKSLLSWYFTYFTYFSFLINRKPYTLSKANKRKWLGIFRWTSIYKHISLNFHWKKETTERRVLIIACLNTDVKHLLYLYCNWHSSNCISNNVLNTMWPYGVENLRSIIGYLVLTLSMLFFLKMKLCSMNLEHIHKVLVPMRQ